MLWCSAIESLYTFIVAASVATVDIAVLVAIAVVVVDVVVASAGGSDAKLMLLLLLPFWFSLFISLQFVPFTDHTFYYA